MEVDVRHTCKYTHTHEIPDMLRICSEKHDIWHMQKTLVAVASSTENRIWMTEGQQGQRKCPNLYEESSGLFLMGFLMFSPFPLLRWIASTQTGLSGRFAAPFAQVHKYALATSPSRMSTEAYHVEKQRKRSLAWSSHKRTTSFEWIARGATARRQIKSWNLGSQMNWSGLIVVSGTSLAKPLIWRVKTGTSEDMSRVKTSEICTI